MMERLRSSSAAPVSVRSSSMKRGSLEGAAPPCTPPSTPPPPPLPPATAALPPASPWKLVGGSVSRPAAARRSEGERCGKVWGQHKDHRTQNTQHRTHNTPPHLPGQVSTARLTKWERPCGLEACTPTLYCRPGLRPTIRATELMPPATSRYCVENSVSV